MDISRIEAPAAPQGGAVSDEEAAELDQIAGVETSRLAAEIQAAIVQRKRARQEESVRQMAINMHGIIEQCCRRGARKYEIFYRAGVDNGAMEKRTSKASHKYCLDPLSDRAEQPVRVVNQSLAKTPESHLAVVKAAAELSGIPVDGLIVRLFEGTEWYPHNPVEGLDEDRGMIALARALKEQSEWLVWATDAERAGTLVGRYGFIWRAPVVVDEEEIEPGCWTEPDPEFGSLEIMSAEVLGEVHLCEIIERRVSCEIARGQQVVQQRADGEVVIGKALSIALLAGRGGTRVVFRGRPVARLRTTGGYVEYRAEDGGQMRPVTHSYLNVVPMVGFPMPIHHLGAKVGEWALAGHEGDDKIVFRLKEAPEIPRARLIGFMYDETAAVEWPLSLESLYVLDEMTDEVIVESSKHGLRSEALGFAMCSGPISRRLNDVVLHGGFSELCVYTPVSEWEPEWGGERPTDPKDMLVPDNGWPRPEIYGPFEVLYQQAKPKVDRLLEFVEERRAHEVKRAAQVTASYASAAAKIRKSNDDPMS